MTEQALEAAAASATQFLRGLAVLRRQVVERDHRAGLGQSIRK